ncbi:MAG: aspartate aminotransferase family protein, partial [Nocardioidaceae bacterium]|nr:aspartate aminotransferase family protein [Nocardioidaceae bacterium]
MSPEEVRSQLGTMATGDLPVHGGRTLAYVYDSGLSEVDALAREAVAAFAGSNGLDPTAYPSLLAMENDLVAFARGLVDGGPSMVGTLTSGGTESCLLAVQGARDSSPAITHPSM